MAFDILIIDEFEEWIEEREADVRLAILKHLALLEERGPNLGRPYVDTVKGSEFPNLKELRVQVGGDPWRVLFAFDPDRVAVLLIGGNKAGERRWYKINVPIADARFRRHLDGLEV